MSAVVVIGQRRQDFLFFFFNDTATTEIYTLSLHDALPISNVFVAVANPIAAIHTTVLRFHFICFLPLSDLQARSEEHTSELQSRLHLVCRLLLEKKKNNLRLLSPPLRRTLLSSHSHPPHLC